MRYLIIDMSKELNGSNSLSLTNHKGEELILNQEESLAKFKEIWDEASLSTKCATSYAEDIDQIYIDKDWEEFKETL